MYELIYSNTIGFSHIKKDIPCQDYGIVKRTDNYNIFVVSDGHGDPNCFRSDRGSKLACESAVNVLTNFVDKLIEEDYVSQLISLDRNLLKQLSASIIGNWLSLIDSDLENDPITDETIKEYTEKTKNKIRFASEYSAGIRPERAYGCTIIAGIQTEDFLLLLHHGDGRCIVIDGDGNPTQPVPWDDRCVGSVTTSCCDSDAIDSIRYAVIDLTQNSVAACFLSSDGVEDSFGSMEAVYSFFFDKIKIAVESGLDELNNELKESLPRLSEMGSADDITICGIIDTVLCKSLVGKFDAYSNKINLELTLEKINKKIDSVLSGGLYNHLKQNYEQADKELQTLKMNYAKACETRSQMSEDLRTLQQQENESTVKDELVAFVNRILGNVKSNSLKVFLNDFTNLLDDIEKMESQISLAEEKYNKSKEEFEEYDNKYKDLIAQKDDIQKQLDEIES